MFYVLVKRLYKVGTGATQQYAPRTTSHTEWHVCGGFTKRPLAERVMAKVMGTHSCLSAAVYTEDELMVIARKTDGEYMLGKTINKFFDTFKK
jgi:predicted GIY-YIG superfamily endonuclease